LRHLLLLVGILSVILSACSNQKDETKPTNESSEVVATEEATGEEEFEVNDFEGNWSSEQQSFTLSFTDDKFGVITFNKNGLASPVQFEYSKPSWMDDQLMLKIGPEQDAAVLTLYDEDSLGYRDNNIRDTLTRTEASQKPKSSNTLLSGFEGKWCNEDGSYCIEIDMSNESSTGIIQYSDNKASFSVVYVEDGYIELDAGGSNVQLTLGDDKETMSYYDARHDELLYKQE